MRPFGELEAAVMNRVWLAGRPVTVRDVVDDLNRDRPLAYTTVMTVLDNLHRKGWLRREMHGRSYRYEPLSSREEYSARLMSEALADSSDTRATLVHFLARLTPAESTALQDLLRRLRRVAP